MEHSIVTTEEIVKKSPFSSSFTILNHVKGHSSLKIKKKILLTFLLFFKKI